MASLGQFLQPLNALSTVQCDLVNHSLHVRCATGLVGCSGTVGEASDSHGNTFVQTDFFCVLKTSKMST